MNISVTSENTFDKLHLPENAKDISVEEWREYCFQHDSKCVKVRITNPIALVVGNTTHRVITASGEVYCVPNVGHAGCHVRWKPKDPLKPVQF